MLNGFSPKLAFFLSLVFLSACSSSLNDYKNTSPEFAMEKFFNGKLRAYGIIQNRSGKVIRRFSADLDGQWNGNKGVLEEDFFYDDGEIQKRIWHLEKLANGRYEGTANDVDGIAIGQRTGFAFNWIYTLFIELDGKEWAIKLNDWIYQLDERRLINRTEMTKWGFKVGEITLLIEKIPTQTQTNPIN